MNNIGSEQYYTNLLYEESFITFLNQVIATEKDPIHIQVAKELLFTLKGNKIITYRPYYDVFYKKYKFTLKTVKSTDGFKITINTLDGQNQRFLGKMSLVTKPLPASPLPPLPNVPVSTPTVLKTTKSIAKSIINPVNTVSINPTLIIKSKPRIDPTLPNPFVGPIYGWPIASRIRFIKIKSQSKIIGDFADWYPRSSKVKYTLQPPSPFLFNSNYDVFFNTIYQFIYFRLIWIKPYTLRVFNGYYDKLYQGTDIQEEWDNFFEYEANKQKMNLYWNWNTPGRRRRYTTFNKGGRWWNLEADIPTNGIYLKQRDFPNSEELVKPEPCDKSVVTEFDDDGPRGAYRPLSFVQNSFVDLLRNHLGAAPPTILNPDYPLLSRNRILYDYSKVPEWAIIDWTKNNDCANKVDYYEYKLVDIHKLVNTISITDPDIESITIKDLPGLTVFEVNNCPKLVSIDLSGANNITEINISICPKLTSVIGISGKKYLKKCNITSTKLTSIGVSNCEILEILNLSNNSLTQINLSGCNALILTSFGNNELTSLDISNNNRITSLDVSNNFLTELDISNNNRLQFLDLTFNKLTQIAVDTILQKFVEFTDSKIDRGILYEWQEGYIYLHGGFNARPSYSPNPNMGMGYYIDLIDPDYISSQDLYDTGASRLTDELFNEFTGYLETLHTDKVNYAKLKKDVISSPYYDPVYAALIGLNGPIKTWRRTNNNDEIVPLYKKWKVTINRVDVPLIIFRTYER